MRLLAIESSCDETAVAVVEIERDTPRVIWNEVASQVKLHAATGGIVPEVAARGQLEAIIPLLERARPLLPYEAIAVTRGPGLIGSLLVGVETAVTLGALWRRPVFGIHHLEGHIYAALEGLKPDEVDFPLLALVVSGGHTLLVLMERHFHYCVVGTTRDDAAGEAFDKIARLLDLGYPGGPAIAAAAQRGRQLMARARPALTRPTLPRPMRHDRSLDFSFSGLKTAVWYALADAPPSDDERLLLAAEVEDAVVEVLVAKTKQALTTFSPRTVVLAGGVAANEQLRKQLQTLADRARILIPRPELTTDNAAMIGLAALWRHLTKASLLTNFTASPRLDLTLESVDAPPPDAYAKLKVN